MRTNFRLPHVTVVLSRNSCPRNSNLLTWISILGRSFSILSYSSLDSARLHSLSAFLAPYKAQSRLMGAHLLVEYVVQEQFNQQQMVTPPCAVPFVRCSTPHAGATSAPSTIFRCASTPTCSPHVSSMQALTTNGLCYQRHP